MTIDPQPEEGETRVPRQKGVIWDNRTDVANHLVGFGYGPLPDWGRPLEPRQAHAVGTRLGHSEVDQ
jgi:hypothetical protein